MGAIDLARQNDPQDDGPSLANGDVERMNRDDLSTAENISGSDANALGIDKDFDTQDDGPEVERLADCATSRPRGGWRTKPCRRFADCMGDNRPPLFYRKRAFKWGPPDR